MNLALQVELAAIIELLGPARPANELLAFRIHHQGQQRTWRTVTVNGKGFALRCAQGTYGPMQLFEHDSGEYTIEGPWVKLEMRAASDPERP